MEIFKRKELINEIIDLDSRDNVKLITGVRRSGKSVLLKCIIEELENRGVNKENIVFVSFNTSEFRNLDEYEIFKRISSKIEDIDGKVYLFFDNVEESSKWQFIVNGFRMKSDCEVYAAVNYSKFYNSDEKAYLAGRCIQFEVYPFSFREFVQFDKSDKPVNELFMEYVKYGGMPEVVQSINHSEKMWNLEVTLEEIRFADLIKNLDVDNFLVKDFLEYMIKTFSEKFSRKEINYYLYDLFPNETISQLLHMLKQSQFMIASNSQYNPRRFRLNDEKYYLVDHGFYNYVNHFWNFSIEEIIRNIIYVELVRRGFKVSFTEDREKYVDFICHTYDKTIYVQFDYLFINEDILKKEIEYLNYHAGDREKYIITTGDYDLSEYGVRHLNIIDFLLGDDIVT